MSNATSWPIFIINLPHAEERRASIQAVMHKLGLDFSFFDATDGNQLSDEEISKVYDSEKNAKLFKRPLSCSEIGCYVSHHKLWTRIANTEGPGAIIFEDDFEATSDLPLLLREICQIDQPASIVKLYAGKPIKGDLVADLSAGYRVIDPITAPAHTIGYIVPRQAAIRLSKRALPFARPVDMDLKHWWELDIQVFAVEPSPLRIVAMTGGGASAIEPSRQANKSKGPLGKLTRTFRNIAYQIRYRTQLLSARAKQDKTSPFMVGRRQVEF
jgi:glycosyl transferase family 25